MRINRIIFLLLPALAIPALLTGQEFLYRLLYLFLIIIALSFLWVRSNVRNVEVERLLRSGRAQVGGMVEERIFLRNRGRWPKLWLEVRDHSDLPGHEVGRLIPHLPGYRERSWLVKTPCYRRGEFTLGAITIAASDPLGLFQMSRALPASSRLIVYPATIPLRGFTLPWGQLSGGDALRRRTHQITTNVSGVREYLPGDSFNRLHWPSIARTGRMISKEFELDPTADIWLLLDMEAKVQAGTPGPSPKEPPSWRAKQAPRLEPTTEEYGVAIAASVAKELLTKERALGLISYGQRRQVVEIDRGERQLNKVLEALAILRAKGQVSLAEAIAAESNRLGYGNVALVITPSTEEGWIAILRDLHRRGMSVAVIHLEASTFGEAPHSLEVIGLLAASNIPTYLVKCGYPLDEALSKEFRT